MISRRQIYTTSKRQFIQLTRTKVGLTINRQVGGNVGKLLIFPIRPGNGKIMLEARLNLAEEIKRQEHTARIYRIQTALTRINHLFNEMKGNVNATQPNQTTDSKLPSNDMPNGLHE